MHKFFIIMLVVMLPLKRAYGQLSLDFFGGTKQKTYNARLVHVHDTLVFAPDILSAFRLNLGVGFAYRFNRHLSLRSQFNLLLSEQTNTKIYQLSDAYSLPINTGGGNRKITAMNIPLELNLHFGRHISVFSGLGLILQREGGHSYLGDEIFQPLFESTKGVYNTMVLTGSYGVALHWRRWSLIGRQQINLTDYTSSFAFEGKRYAYPVELRQLYIQLGYSLPLKSKG